jgi:hypothetical protein
MLRRSLFSAGFAVSPWTISGGLGISKKTLYAHFPAVRLLEAVLADKLAGVEAKLRNYARAPARFPGDLRSCWPVHRELDEIKPPFVRDMRQKAPDVFKLVERRRAAVIQRYFGKFSPKGNGGNGAQGCSGQADHRNLAGDGSIDHESAEDGGLGMMPKEGFSGFLRSFSSADIEGTA